MIQLTRIRIPAWLRHQFAGEQRVAMNDERHVPDDAPCLCAGDRVEFDVHPGVDGPWYATNVRPIDDEDDPP